MTTLASSPTGAPALSAHADRLLAHFRSAPMHWIVLNHACATAAAGLSEAEILDAVRELEVAELVERAPYGPLLFIR